MPIKQCTVAASFVHSRCCCVNFLVIVIAKAKFKKTKFMIFHFLFSVIFIIVYANETNRNKTKKKKERKKELMTIKLILVRRFFFCFFVHFNFWKCCFFFISCVSRQNKKSKTGCTRDLLTRISTRVHWICSKWKVID